MISILIPTYNYDAFPLVENLHTQCVKADIVFEIYCFDDGSMLEVAQNRKINTLSHCSHRAYKKNIGRLAMRNKLAESANFKWLLFLDSDVYPIKNNFISLYIDKISNTSKKIIFGGICYEESNSKQNLRHYYGTHREQKKTFKKNNPIQFIVSANMLIDKEVFFSINTVLENKYGMDYLMSAEIDKQNIDFIHISNEVYHLGLESNKTFLNKSKESAFTIRWLYENNFITEKQSQLIVVHHWLKKWKVVKLFQLTGSIFIDPVEWLLVRNKAPLVLFDFYRLYYYITSDSQ